MILVLMNEYVDIGTYCNGSYGCMCLLRQLWSGYVFVMVVMDVWVGFGCSNTGGYGLVMVVMLVTVVMDK